MTVRFHPLAGYKHVGILHRDGEVPVAARYIRHSGEAKDIFTPRSRTPLPLIQDIVAKHYGISPEHMTTKDRKHFAARPRQVAMYLTREFTRNSLPEIGRRFGGRDHTTVIHAIRQVEARIASDPEIAADVASLRARLAE